MIRFSYNKKDLSIFRDDDSEPFITLELTTGTITNKFNIITRFIEDMSKFLGDDFDDWFQYGYLLGDTSLEDNVPILKHWCDAYLDSLKIDYSEFVNVSKQKNKSILFVESEIEAISRFSCYAKLFSIFFNTNLKPSRSEFKEIYKELASDILKPEIIDKIFSLVQVRTYSYNLTDRYMWDYLEVFQCKNIDVHVIEIFNFIMNNIIVLVQPNKNPITYFTSVVNESVKWFLKSVYKSTIVYNDSVSAQDIYSSGSNVKSYSYNDTLGILKQASYKYIYNKLESENDNKFVNESDDLIVKFQSKLEKIECMSPVSEYISFPILVQLTGVPYKYFTTLKPDDSFAINAFLQHFLENINFGYKNVFQLLNCIPFKSPVMTTYKVKCVSEYLNRDDFKFYSFRTRVIPYKFINIMVGRIRVRQVNMFNEKRVNVSEVDLVSYFCDYFSQKVKVDESSKREFKRILLDY